MWQETFKGICFNCDVVFSLTFPHEPPINTSSGREVRSMRWWADCPLCNSEYGAKESVAWRWNGGHRVDV